VRSCTLPFWTATLLSVAWLDRRARKSSAGRPVALASSHAKKHETSEEAGAGPPGMDEPGVLLGVRPAEQVEGPEVGVAKGREDDGQSPGVAWALHAARQLWKHGSMEAWKHGHHQGNTKI
jgi:hypothetical protein